MTSPTKLQLLALITLAILATTVSAGGKKDHGEECSMLAQTTNLFTNDKNDDPNACNTDKGLICFLNKCSCSPGRAYEKGILGGIFGGGSCVGAANSPCLGGQDSSAKCVSNAHCGDGSVSICKCSEGYSATSEGHCSNGSNNLTPAGDGIMTPIYIFGLLLSYLFVNQ